jgi:hypothetical protein
MSQENLSTAQKSDAHSLVMLIRYATVHANTGALTELFTCGKAGSPVITRLSGGDLLLAKDAIGIAIGPDGKPSRKVLFQNILTYHAYRQNPASCSAQRSATLRFGNCRCQQHTCRAHLH